MVKRENTLVQEVKTALAAEKPATEVEVNSATESAKTKDTTAVAKIAMK